MTQRDDCSVDFITKVWSKSLTRHCVYSLMFRNRNSLKVEQHDDRTAIFIANAYRKLTAWLSVTQHRERTPSPDVAWQREHQSWALMCVVVENVQTESFFCRMNVESTSKVLRVKMEQTVFGVLPVRLDYPVPRVPRENPEWYLILTRDWWVMYNKGIEQWYRTVN